MTKPDPQRAITDQEFDELLDDELKWLQKLFTKPQADFMPGLKVLTRRDFDGELSCYAVGLAAETLNATDRYELFNSVGRMAWHKRHSLGAPVAVVFTAEAWQRKFNKKETKDFMKTTKKVSDYADKQECLVTYGSTIDGRHFMAIHSLDRDKQNRITGITLTMYAPYQNTKQPAVESDLVAEFFRGCRDVIDTGAEPPSHLSFQQIKIR